MRSNSMRRWTRSFSRIRLTKSWRVCEGRHWGRWPAYEWEPRRLRTAEDGDRLGSVHRRHVRRSCSPADRARAIVQLPFSVAIACAKREYEAWLLASLCTIEPGRVYEGDPEGPRDPKGWLRRNLGYRQTREQATYTTRLDVATVAARSRSFRRAVRVLVSCRIAAQIEPARDVGCSRRTW